MSAAFLCAELGITNDPRPDHAQYMAQYLTILKNDKKAIFAAAAAASAATDFILAFSRKATGGGRLGGFFTFGGCLT